MSVKQWFIEICHNHQSNQAVCRRRQNFKTISFNANKYSPHCKRIQTNLVVCVSVFCLGMVVAFARSRTNKDNVNVWTTWNLPGVGQDGSEQQSNQISNMWRRSILAYSMAIAHKSGLSAHCCNILHPLAGFPDMKTKSLPMSRFLHLSTLGIFYPSQSIPFNTISSQIRCASLLHIILHLARLWRKKLSIIHTLRI